MMTLGTPRPFRDREALPLFDFQQEALDAVLSRWAAGVNSQIVSIPTGGGKTVLATHMVDRVGRPAVFMCHRDELVTQTREKFRQFDPSISTAICKAEQGRSVYELAGRDLVIASAQTLGREQRLRTLVDAVGDGAFLIVDECFPAGTLIDGRPIETVRIGDLVTAFNEATGLFEKRRVVRLFSRHVMSRLRSIMVGPTEVICTPNHPFWTRRGWVPAGDLTTTDEVLRYGSMQDVRPALSASAAARTATRDLLPGVPECGQRRADGAHEQGSRVGQNGDAQPDASRRQPRAHGGNAPRDGAPASGTGRKRAGVDGAAGALAGGARRGLGRGVRGHDWDAQTERTAAADSLQNRYCPPRLKDGRRDRRLHAYGASGEGRGRQEECLARWVRVDRVEDIEPGDHGDRSRVGGPGVEVFNLEVEGLHTYTANGIVVHNCHHAAADSWRRAIAAINPALLVGLTATPKRGDGAGLDGVFQEIVYAVPMSRLVKSGKLARPVGIAIGTGVDLDGVATRGGEFVESQLEVVVNTEARNELVVDAWEKHAADRAQTIAFCVDVAHAKALTEAFRARGHNAEYVIGATPDHERRSIYAAFHDGEVNILLSVMVLSEGFDEPRASCALMCRPTQSQSLYVQMAGRVLRRSPGKNDALVLDFVDVTRRHSLQTVMTLAGDEPGAARTPKGESEQGTLIDVFATQERRASVKAQTERLGDLLDASNFIWQQLPDGQWMARSSDGWITLVEDAEGGFVPVRVWWKDGAAGHEELFGRAVDADTAMSIAEASIDRNVLTDRGAHWRDLPPTPGQVQAAGRWRVQVTPEMTRGQLTNLLDVAVFRVAMKKAGLTRRAG